MTLTRTILAFALCATAFCGTAAQAQDVDPRTSPLLADLVYGAYCAEEPERRDPAPETASGTINIVPAIPDFRFRQRIVPAEIGIGFGVLASTAPGVYLEPVTVTVTHPPYGETGITTERWVTDIDEAPNLMGFSFDTTSELVLGEWTFSAVNADGEELYFISFEVVAPELMPQIMSTCFGSYLS